MIFALALRVVIQEEERRRQGNADHTGYGNLLGHGPPSLAKLTHTLLARSRTLQEKDR
jgi:hypothetical protein